MPNSTKHLLEFGPYRLDPAERVLLRDGRPVSLTPKAIDTLLALTENHGHIMDKEELLKKVWPDTFVEEATLAKNVSTLRQTLGDTGETPLYIETVPRRGYRFIGEVRRVALSPGVSANDGSTPPPATGTAHANERSALRIWVAFALVGLMGASLAYYSWRFGSDRGSGLTARRLALAVLPFRNLTGNTEDDYLTEGLTEEMISRLGRLAPHQLAVIARTTSMRYRDTGKSAGEIGQELNVDYVIEGSVRREGELVRINVQLIETKSQTHVWAENYDRDLTQILQLQREVGDAIAQQVRLWMGSETFAGESRAELDRPVNPEAHQLYLKGRFYWHKRSPEGIEKAIEFLQRAIDLEPTYARAWSALADTYILQNEYGGLPAEVVYAKARFAAARALEIDPAIGETHATEGLLRSVSQWDWAGAEREFRQAVELNPNYATARHWYAYGPLFAAGRFAEARRQLEEARKLDPFSTAVAAALGQSYYLEREYDPALSLFESALRLTPRPNFGIYFHIALTYSQLGRHDEAIAAAKEGIRLAPAGDGGEYLAYAYARAGQTGQARRVLSDVQQHFVARHGSPFVVAGTFAALGEKDSAFAWLERCLEGRTSRVTQAAHEPMLDPLRTDPRFTSLLQRMGLHMPERFPASSPAGKRVPGS